MIPKKEIVNWQRLIITTLLIVVASTLTSSVTWFILDRTFNESQETNYKLVNDLEKKITYLNDRLGGGTTTAGVQAVAQNGTISGSIAYPASSIPTKIKIFAEDTKTAKIYEATVTFADATQEMTTSATYTVSVPAGSYYVYGTLTDFNDQNGTPWRAYYNEFVVCGMGANCKDVSKIALNVEAAKNLPSITIGDWYPTK